MILFIWGMALASAAEPYVPGELIVRYKHPVAVQATALPAMRPGATGTARRPEQGIVHASPSLARLDRKFGLISAKRPGAPGSSNARFIARSPRSAGSQSILPAQQSSWRVLSFGADADIQAIAAAYARDPEVAYAEPNTLGSLCHVPADPAYASRQRTLYNTLHLEPAWDTQTGNPSVLIAVIDSGVDVNHPDLAGAIAPGGWDYADGDNTIEDDLGHGTRVAGIIAAAENGQGGVGAAFGCRILPYDVSDARGQVRLADVAAAIEDAAAQGAQVINLSLSFRYSAQILQEACAKAAETAVIVGAAGNDGQGDAPRYPAASEGVIGVGAVDEDGSCAIFSNFNGRCGSLVKLVAPGVGIYATTPGGGWSGGAEASGTSYAAPFVSAAAALLRAQHPEQSPAAIARHLQKTATRLPNFQDGGAYWRYVVRRDMWSMGANGAPSSEQGAGLVNPQAALTTPMTPAVSVTTVAVLDDPALDPANDGDGEFDQGETVQLRVGLAAADADVLKLQARLNCADPRIALVDGATTVTELGLTQDALRCGKSTTLVFGKVHAVANAGRGDAPFTLHCSGAAGTLTDQAFTVRIENKVKVSGPQPDIHFTSDKSYQVDSDLTLSGNCLIDPGTPFTVAPGKKIRLLSGGSLTALGTAAAPIKFTSLCKIPDLTLASPTSDRPIAGLTDPHNVGLEKGMTAAALEAQCGPKTEAVNLSGYRQVRYVSATSGSDTTGNGSAASPWRSIQYALSQIADASAAKNYAVLVAAGTYSNTAATTGTAVVTMKEWVDLWGGFAPGSWKRNLATQVSTIDGVGTYPHRCVNGANNARIDGFTVTRGYASNGILSGDAANYGGGIYCSGISPTITNNIISGNSALGDGGGIFCNQAAPTISNNILSGNSAINGGGIFYNTSSPTIANNIISGNSVSASGGGICTVQGSGTITNNILSGNMSGSGGGIACNWPSSDTISNNVLTGNSAQNEGGGIDLYVASPTITNNFIAGNSATQGAGIYCYRDSCPTISNNIISGNLATIKNNGGGAGAGIVCGRNSAATISHNVFSGNRAESGDGGISCGDSAATISNNVISGNSSDAGVGGISCGGVPPTISNNVISGNSANSIGGIFCQGVPSPSISNNVLSGNAAVYKGGAIGCDRASPAILNCIIRDNTSGLGGPIENSYNASNIVISHTNISGGWAGPGSSNVDTDPQFIGAIASGTVRSRAYDRVTSTTTLNVSGTGLEGRDLTGWVVKVGRDLTSPTLCACAPILAATTTTLVVAGDATHSATGVTITAPANWEIFDYRLQPDSPMKGLGLGPDNQATTYSTQIARFDAEGQPRIGARCEIGPDEAEWETDFTSSVWGGVQIDSGATVRLKNVAFENGSGVRLDGTASGGIESCQFFQQYGAGLDATRGTLSAVTNTSATACWGTGIAAPAAALQNATAERNRGTGLVAASARDSQSRANRGHGFDLSGAAVNLSADDNTTDGIRAATVTNGVAKNNGGWGVRGDATNCDAQNNGAGGIRGAADRCRVIANGGPGVMNGSRAARCEVRDNATTGVLGVGVVESCTISGNGGAGVAGATQVTGSSVADNGGPGAVGGAFFDTTLSGNRGAGVRSPARLSHCTVSRNAGDGVVGTGATGTVNNTLVSVNEGSGLINLASVNQSNVIGNFGYAALDTMAAGGGTRNFTGNYWGALATDELTTKPEGANLSFIQDALDGAGAWSLDVWPYATATVPEAPRAGGPPWAWRVKPDLTTVAGVGTTTFTITYTASMNTAIDPSVSFGLDEPYQLRIVLPSPGWISPTTWQGTYTIGTNTGDGINTLRIGGAVAADGYPLPDDTSHQFYINTRDPHVANNGLASTLGKNSVRCSWNPVESGAASPRQKAEASGSGGYNLLMSPDLPVNFQKVNPSIILGTDYTVNGLTPQTLYWFKVQRVEADETTTDWTPIFCAWTLANTTPTTITMTYTIHVLDSATRQPIPGAVVTLSAETQAQATTGDDGWATLSVSAQPQSTVQASITQADHENASRTYTTTANLTDEILLTPKAASALRVTIHGRTTQAATGLPIAGVTIRAQGTSTAQTQTDSQGAYTLDVSAVAGDFISLSAEGGGLSGSAFVTAATGSQQVDFVLRPAAPAAPSLPGATGITPAAITWTWHDNATGESGYEIFAGPGPAAPMTSSTLTTANSQSWSQSGLSPNTQYAFQVRARNAGGTSAKTANLSRYTLAATPRAPRLAGTDMKSARVDLGSGDGNPACTLYAISISPAPTGGGGWLRPDGSTGPDPAWHTAAQWSPMGTGILVSGLAPSTKYQFAATARNEEGVPTASGPAASATTTQYTGVAADHWRPYR